MGTGCHLGADLLQMLVHGLGIDGGHDDGGTDAAGRADRAEQMHGVMPIVAHHQRPRANRCPDIGVSSLLADPGFILEPNLYGRAGDRRGERVPHQAVEVFLKASCASASFFGWNGRGCSRVRPSWCNHLPIVLSCTSTEKRRATSSRKSRQRQRTTLSCVGSGPLMTRARSERTDSIALPPTRRDVIHHGCWRG